MSLPDGPPSPPPALAPDDPAAADPVADDAPPGEPGPAPAASRPDRLAGWLVRVRWPLLAVALASVAAAFGPAQELALERSIESLFAPADPRLVAYEASRDWFGGDEFVVVAWDETDPTDEPGLDRIAAFAAELSAVPGVNPASTQDLDKVLRPANVSRAFSVLIRTREAELVALSEGVLLGADGTTVAVVLRLVPEKPGDPITGPGSRAETFHEIRALAAAHDPPAAVAGEPVQVHDAFEAVEGDGRTLFFVSLGLLGAVLLLLFRSVRWVLIPLAVVLAAIWWTRAGLYLSGARLSMVSSMLNSLVTIVAVATATHLAIAYREFRRRPPGGTKMPRADALRATLSRLAAPIFWSCATTAAGFLSLLAAELTPVRSFGLMMGLGSAAVLLGTFALVPGLALAGDADTTPRDAPAEGLLTGLLGGGPAVILKYKWPLAAGTVLLSVLSVLGMYRLDVETDFSKNFRAGSPIVVSLDYIEEKLGGAGSWEVNFPAPRSAGGLTEEYLAKVRGLAAELRGLEVDGAPAVTKVVALTDTLDLIPTIPFFDNSPAGKLAQIRDFAPEVEPSLYDADAGRMRVVLRSLERQPSARKKATIAGAEAAARAAFPPSTGDAAPPAATGLFVLLTFLIESLLRDQVVSFCWAAAGIFAMMWAAFGRVKYALAAMLPNLLPIGLVLGGLGWAGLPANIGTAMIASVSVGLTVDGNIHYIAAYVRRRRAGSSRRDALREAHATVGRAMTFATLALACGFAVLILSQFVPLVYFGALVSLAMIGGLAGDLVLLPLMLGWRDG